MNSFASSRRAGAFTLVEMLTVIAIIAILAAFLLPVLSQSQLRAKRAWCESNLRQLGIAFHTFANDHNGKFPMAVSTNDVGSMEFVQNGFTAGETFYTSFRHFQSLSGELGRPAILICPTDTRLAAANFSALQNENVSYFVGVDADFGKPGSILAGDRNLATNSLQHPTILQMGAGSWLRWTRELHQFKGNILFADGHVEEWNNSALTSAENGLPEHASLFLPSVKPDENMPIAGQRFSPAPSAAVPPGNQSSRAPGAASSEAKSFNGTRTAPAGVENPPGANRTLPTASVAPGGTAASDNNDLTMSPFDQRLARSLRHFLEWSYFLLLLLLLLFLAYKLWRRMQKQNAQRQMARLKQDAEESTLDSDTSFR